MTDIYFLKPLVLLVLYIVLKLSRLRSSRFRNGDSEKEQFFAALRDLERKARETVDTRVPMQDLRVNGDENPGPILDDGIMLGEDRDRDPIPHEDSDHELVEEPKGALQTNFPSGIEVMDERDSFEQAINRLQ